MTPDTTAIRARDGGGFLTEAERDALCDGYDEAQRLRADVAMSGHAIDAYVGALAAERERFAALVADLRALCDRYEHADERFNPPTGQQVAAKLSAVIDRHAPDTTGGAG